MKMPPGRKVSLVEAKVVSLSPSVRTVNIRGAEREVRNCCISDGTAQITPAAVGEAGGHRPGSVILYLNSQQDQLRANFSSPPPSAPPAATPERM
ncbi:hypothetical protein MHYP_G00013400 [Metynnis hypsauchen]